MAETTPDDEGEPGKAAVHFLNHFARASRIYLFGHHLVSAEKQCFHPSPIKAMITPRS